MSEGTTRTPNGVSGYMDFEIGFMEFAPNTRDFLISSGSSSASNAGDAAKGGDDIVVSVGGEIRSDLLVSDPFMQPAELKVEGELAEEKGELEVEDKDDTIRN